VTATILESRWVHQSFSYNKSLHKNSTAPTRIFYYFGRKISETRNQIGVALYIYAVGSWDQNAVQYWDQNSVHGPVPRMISPI